MTSLTRMMLEEGVLYFLALTGQSSLSSTLVDLLT